MDVAGDAVDDDITPWSIVKPDLQWIVNPGGNNAADALVATLRTSVSF